MLCGAIQIEIIPHCSVAKVVDSNLEISKEIWLKAKN
jgi:hypothetical protein